MLMIMNIKKINPSLWHNTCINRFRVKDTTMADKEKMMTIYAIRRQFIPIVIVAALTAGAPFTARAGGNGYLPVSAPPELARLIEEGLSNNQSIRALEAETAASRERIVSAGALPDPRIGFGLQNLPTDSFRFDKEPMTQKQVAVEQKIPWLSKLDLDSQMAAMTFAQKQASAAAARITLAKRIADAYWSLGDITRQQVLNDRLIKLVTRIRRDAQSQYSVGKGQQQNIFQAEVELSQLTDTRIKLENKRRSLADRLNELLNREQRAPIAPPGLPPLPDLQLQIQALTATALVNNPDMRIQKAAMDRARLAVKRARKDYYPDTNLRLAYGQRDHDRTGRDLPDFFSASVMMNIPLWQGSSQDKDLKAALADRDAAENNYQDLRRRLPYQIDTRVTAIRDTMERVALYRDSLIPQTRQWARSSDDAYQVDRVAFDTMIDARMRVLEIELTAHRLMFQLYQQRAELEALIGKPLSAGGNARPHGNSINDNPGKEDKNESNEIS